MKFFINTCVICIQLIFTYVGIYAQETVTDYDGNVYNTIAIGEQVWLKENLKSLHYSDGTEIPGVVDYNNDDS
ncbi:MAG: fibrobacter succinogenes major paralogous domain-containing protein, partial [Ignavibacteriaceae bacterium]|nr:fibrobacter succinogenes major paralogous domain-containing protein [Ignavibacteriaceae bacterium]